MWPGWDELLLIRTCNTSSFVAFYKKVCLRSPRLLVGSLFNFRHDLQAEVQHGMGIADKIATAGKNEVQVIIQFQTATEIWSF